MVRSRSPLLSILFLLAWGCGGRDPLDVPVDDGTGAPPTNPGNGGTGHADAAPPTSTPPGSTPGMTPPGTTPPSNPPPTNPPPTNPPPTNPPPGPPDAGAPRPSRDAGTVPATNCAPKCLAALMSNCIPSGTCVQQQQRGGRGGGGSATCYANGVKFLPQAGGMGGGGGGATMTRVMAPDGTLCYTISVENAAGVLARTYYGPMGDMVARVTDQNGLSAVTCTGQTNPEVVMSTCLGPNLTGGGGGRGGGGGGGAMCMQGMCM